ncbi:MAG: amidohydrolase [Ruminococcaceae bacterium]|nr:amidohydrolase [Oscillospiraceae bacterium]
MSIIDFHCHIYPEKIAEKAVKSVGEFYNIEMDAKGTSEHLIKLGSKCGITNYVVHSVAVDKDHVQTINNYIASECEEHKEFIGFMTMHADYENKLEEAERAKKLGLKGVKIHPDTQKYNMDDKRMYELYDYLQSEELPLLIHTGDYRYSYSHPSRLRKLLDDFPRLIAIGAHFGGWSLYDLALEYLKDTNCYLDTSSSLDYIGLKRAKELINIYGAERILYGTDFPMWSPDDELKKFFNIGLDDSQNELILCKNAQRILKL